MSTVIPSVERLIRLFDACFYQSYKTRLARASGEPEYIPANAACADNRICFAHGFVASALHEISHWCVAGAERRRLYDFGYWYEPDGRNAAQQAAFMQVEVKPQALEWIFSNACGLVFRPSLDNLSGETGDVDHFFDAVARQARHYCEYGLPERAQQWAEACAAEFGADNYAALSLYNATLQSA